MDKIILMHGGKPVRLSRTHNNPFSVLPPVGSLLTYKKFNKNPAMTKPDPPSVQYRVLSIETVVEEDWNGLFETTIMIHLSEE